MEVVRQPLPGVIYGAPAHYDEQVEIIRLLVKTLGWSWDRARRAVEKGIADKVLEALRELKGKS